MQLENINILTVSSANKNQNENEEESIDDIPMYIDSIPIKYLDRTANHATLYISEYVDRAVMKKIKCEKCLNIFSQKKNHFS